MDDRLNIEIGGELVPILLRFAEERGRPPDEIIEEALALYLRASGMELGPGIGRPIREVYIDPPEDRPAESFAELFERVGRWQRERGVDPLSDDEALRLAVEEQHAWRSGREARR